MQKESKDFLLNLLKTPGTSGFEQGIQKVVKKRMSKIADEVTVDVHGNLNAVFNPGAPIRVMLAGHCDQIGLMVNHIDKKGFIYVGSIGGIDPAVLPGSRLTIHGESGPVEGIIGHKPVHLLTQAERGRRVELSKIWVDIGAKDDKEAKKQVAVGDSITWELNPTIIGGTKVVSPGCDNRAGVFVVMEALRLVKAATKGSKKKFPVEVNAVSTVQEEIGLRGAVTSCFGIDPHVGIAVDVTHATDNPGADEKIIGTCHLGEGPGIIKGANINPKVRELLEKAAKKKKISYQSLGRPRALGTDANVMQISRAGVATAHVAIPNRYMHTPVEMVDLKDLENAAKVIAEAILLINRRTSFIPV